MTEVKVLKANTPENPYSRDVTIETEGPLATVYCMFCEMSWNDTLERARARYLEHQGKAHEIAEPRVHSFFRKEIEERR